MFQLSDMKKEHRWSAKFYEGQPYWLWFKIVYRNFGEAIIYKIKCESCQLQITACSNLETAITEIM